MRFIHTADWHLGRLFHTVHLTEDQQYVLDQFVDLVADVRPAAVIIAGDVYDRGVPPTEAVELLNDVLGRIVRGLGVPVVMIAGNHDSPSRLGFGSELLAAEGLHIAGPLPAGGALTVPFADDNGPLFVQAVPYADPVDVRAAFAEPAIQTHEQAMRALAARARGLTPAGARSLFVGHAFVAGAATSDSERPLTVGGAGTVPAAVFEGFDYVALGHLHLPQRAGAEAIRYAGSLLTYSFKEVAQHKSVSVVEIGAPGSGVLQAALVGAAAAKMSEVAVGAAGGAMAGDAGDLAAGDVAAGDSAADPAAAPFATSSAPNAARVTVEEVELRPRRRVRVIEGTLRELLDAAPADEGRADYLCARLTDKGALLNAMAQLQQAYPNCLHLERPSLELEGRPTRLADLATRSESQHFAAFFEFVTDERLSAGERAAFDAVIDRLERRRRET
jgi:exonuclease SbcD